MALSDDTAPARNLGKNTFLWNNSSPWEKLASTNSDNNEKGGLEWRYCFGQISGKSWTAAPCKICSL